MNKNENTFRERLLAVETLSPSDQYQRELQALLEPKLTPGSKWATVGSLVMGLGFAGLFGTLAIVTARGLPWLAIAVFALGAIFGLAWAGLSAWILHRGTINRRTDPTAATGMVWGFLVVMMTLFLLLAGQLPDPVKGLQMVLNGLVFLVMGAVFMIANRIEQAELRTKEKLLELEYRLAEMAEARTTEPPKAS